MSRTARRRRSILEKANHAWPKRLVPVRREDWPPSAAPNLVEVWRSRTHLVQVYAEASGWTRLTVNRTSLERGSSHRWESSITWDTLHRLKAECGRVDAWAVEVFPPPDEVVNVANMRHLWVYPAGQEPPQFSSYAEEPSLIRALARTLIRKIRR